jgi:hypothetical protein
MSSRWIIAITVALAMILAGLAVGLNERQNTIPHEATGRDRSPKAVDQALPRSERSTVRPPDGKAPEGVGQPAVKGPPGPGNHSSQ